MITAGCAIGAGMFSLPVASSGMWFGISLIVLLTLWYFNYISSLFLLEVNLQYPPGASFDTFVKAILGKKWNVITGLNIAFLLYILLYAYFSAFGNMMLYAFSDALEVKADISPGMLSLLFGAILATFVYKSTYVVGRLCTILVVGMGLTFLLSIFGLSLQVEVFNLLDSQDSGNPKFPYVWSALPYFLTSFGFSSVVPSLYKYYGNEPYKIQKSLFYGSMIALVVYALFLFISFGIISRQDFATINASGGNMGTLVNALTENSDNSMISSAFQLFSNFAIISSFLGVGLSLFDYVADRFDFSNDNKGRLYSAMITFLPPGIASFFFPNGFIAAIGFAGLVMLFAYFIVPLLMVWKTRLNNVEGEYKVWGGNVLLYVVLAGALLVGICYILTKLGHLPVY